MIKNGLSTKIFDWTFIWYDAGQCTYVIVAFNNWIISTKQLFLKADMTDYVAGYACSTMFQVNCAFGVVSTVQVTTILNLDMH